MMNVTDYSVVTVFPKLLLLLSLFLFSINNDIQQQYFQKFQVDGKELYGDENYDDEDYISIRKGPFSKIEMYGARGIANATITIFQSKVIKAEVICSSIKTNSRFNTNFKNGIQTTLYNPYDYDLTFYFKVDENRLENYMVLQPGESRLLPRLIQQNVADDDDYFRIAVDNDPGVGLIYGSDGSYYAVYGTQSILAIDKKGDGECLATGTFMAVVPLHDELKITKIVSDDDVVELQKELKEGNNMKNLGLDSSQEKDIQDISNKQEKYQMKMMKREEKRNKIIENLEKDGKTDNYLEKKLGNEHNPVNFFEAKGNFGDTLTLFESNVVKAEFLCSENYTYDYNKVANGISVNVTNPYDYNLILSFSIEFGRGYDSKNVMKLEPGESFYGFFAGNAEYELEQSVDTNADEAVIYISDGSYFSVFGSQTIFSIDPSLTRQSYNCITAGSFIGIASHNQFLSVSKNAKTAENILKSEKYKRTDYAEKMVQKENALYEKALQTENTNKNFVNHYMGPRFGTNVFVAQGYIGDEKLTLFESKSLKAEFKCKEFVPLYDDDTTKSHATIDLTYTNNYHQNVSIYATTSFVPEDTDTYLYDYQVVLPGETVVLPFAFSTTISVDSRDMNYAFYASDGTYFAIFGEQTIIANKKYWTPMDYNCLIAGPYFVQLGNKDILKNTYSGPVTDKLSLRLNNLFSNKDNYSKKKFKKTFERIENKHFSKQRILD